MVFMGSVPFLTHAIHTGKKRKRKKRSEPPPLRERWRKIREPQAEVVCGGMLCVCGSLTRHAPTIKKHLIAPQNFFQNAKKGCIKIHRGIKIPKDIQIIMHKGEYSMNKRRFGKPMRLKAVLEYCKLSEKEKKEYKIATHAKA